MRSDPPLNHGFHYRDGWMFLRLDDGTVRLSRLSHRRGKPDDDGAVYLEIDQHGWASIVSSVSRDGEDNGRYYEALAFHGEEKVE